MRSKSRMPYAKLLYEERVKEQNRIKAEKERYLKIHDYSMIKKCLDNSDTILSIYRANK